MKLGQHCFFLIILFFSSCAIQVQPEGGNKDLEPPHVLSTSPPSNTTNFTGHDIRLNFDEYIALNEINSQLIVSPLLKHPVETKVRKRSVLVHFEDTLLANSTYTLNFGQGIVDYNEGNKLENYQYVFSTGSVIDSLMISGRIKSAFDNKTSKGIIVMLYKESYDSLPFLDRPLYFSRTNDSGQYEIKNISPGFYKVIALQETNGDYLYLKGEESIGFTDTLIQAGSQNVDLNVFKEISDFHFLKAYSEFAGKAVFVFNGKADTIKWNWLTDESKLNIHSVNYSQNKDSVFIWYKNLEADSIAVRFDNSLVTDTVVIRLFKQPGESFKKNKSKFTISSENGEALQHLYLPFSMVSNHPISKYDFQQIILKEDSIPVSGRFYFSDSLHLKLMLDYKWKNKGKYSVFIPPATFTDIYGIKNDTVLFDFTTHGEMDYGSMKLIFIDSQKLPYVIQLIDEKETNVFREFNSSGDTTVEISNLDPHVYKVKLIQDRNGNGKWDTGDYLNHFQPEVVEYYKENITVRSNWDVDIYIRVPLK